MPGRKYPRLFCPQGVNDSNLHNSQRPDARINNEYQLKSGFQFRVMARCQKQHFRRAVVKDSFQPPYTVAPGTLHKADSAIFSWTVHITQGRTVCDDFVHILLFAIEVGDAPGAVQAGHFRASYWIVAICARVGTIGSARFAQRTDPRC